MKSIASWAVLLTAILVALPGLAQTKKPKVVATFLPMYLFTKAVTGSAAQVEMLIPPGTDVHEYQASPSNARSIAQAQVVVMNGLGFEEFMAQLLKNVSNKKLKVIDASQGITVLTEDKSSEKTDDHEGNPHVWLDPVHAMKQVQNIRDGLVAADPTNRKTYQANADAYIQQLVALDRQFKTRLAPVKGCKFIAFHDAFPYLARRYGLQQVAIVELPGDAFTPKDIQKVKSLARQFQVKALLSEPGVEDKRLQQIAQDLKLPIKSLDPLESGKLDPQYYFQAMGENLKTLEAACK